MNKEKFEKGKEYKLFGISSFMAHTTSLIFRVNRISEQGLIIQIKNYKGNWERKERLLIDNKENIIIPLNDCVLIADSETGNFMGNACFNFCNSEIEIIEQLKLNLNENFETNFKINSVINGEYKTILGGL